MKGLIIFAVGGIAGGIAGYFICKSKYEKLIEEEIESVKESYKVKYGENKEGKDGENKEGKDDNDILNSINAVERADFEDRLGKLGYTTSLNNDEEEEDIAPVEAEDSPYYISPDEYGEVNGFGKETLVYYEDSGDLINESEERIDISVNVGEDFINHFGEYETDAVFVRNERIGMDYEVLMEHTSYGGE